MKEVKVTCTVCPLGCNVTLNVEKGKVANINIKGYRCIKGEKYALQEFKDPKRVLTTTVRTNDIKNPLLSVRTTSGIPKKLLKSSMEILSKIKVNPPIPIGQVIFNNINNTGVDVISTKNL